MAQVQCIRITNERSYLWCAVWSQLWWTESQWNVSLCLWNIENVSLTFKLLDVKGQASLYTANHSISWMFLLLIHPKMKMVIIYSPSFNSKPVIFFFKNDRTSDTLNFWDGQHTHSVLTYRHLSPHHTERKCGKTPLSHMHQFLFIPFLPLTHPSLHSTHSEWSIVELSQGVWYNGLILTRSKLKGNTDPKSLERFCIL